MMHNKHETALLKLLAKLGIKAAARQLEVRSVLRAMKFANIRIDLEDVI